MFHAKTPTEVLDSTLENHFCTSICPPCPPNSWLFRFISKQNIAKSTNQTQKTHANISVVLPESAPSSRIVQPDLIPLASLVDDLAVPQLLGGLSHLPLHPLLLLLLLTLLRLRLLSCHLVLARKNIVIELHAAHAGPALAVMPSSDSDMLSEVLDLKESLRSEHILSTQTWIK
jgi:hypothetical protein